MSEAKPFGCSCGKRFRLNSALEVYLSIRECDADVFLSLICQQAHMWSCGKSDDVLEAEIQQVRP